MLKQHMLQGFITRPFTNFSVSFALLLFLICCGCAKVGIITGGLKDVNPPVMVGSKPELYDTGFRGKRVQVDFDEFLQLKDINQQFNVSPPLKKKAKVWLKNKSVMVDYTDTLTENTTYTLNFGNAITDNNEGNILPNFEFVFSTGSYIDSMSVRGQVRDAFTLAPDKEPLLAVLYSNLSDSAPFKEKPRFTSRTNKEGYFAINNVKPGIYRLYVIKDGNFNYMFDPPLEAFAFADTVLTLNNSFIASLVKPKKFRADSALTDSMTTNPKMDSMLHKLERNSISIDLLSFLETDKKQYVKNYGRTDKHKLDLVFTNRLKNDSLLIRPLYFNASNWLLRETGPKHDSLLLWIKDTALTNVDTLKCSIGFWGTNKTMDTVWVADTLNFRYINDQKADKRSKKQHSDTLTLKLKLENPLDINAKPYFELPYPVTSTNPQRIQLVQKLDSTLVPRTFDLVADTVFPRRFYVMYAWDDDAQYELTAYPGCFTDMYNSVFDTLKQQIKIQKAEAYGKIMLSVSNVNQGTIVQLLDKDKVMYEKYCTTSGVVSFEYLKPAQYSIKAIYDTDNNKIFTTGNYLLKQQPEKVLFYNAKEIINVRANWDLNLNWTLEQPSTKP